MLTRHNVAVILGGVVLGGVTWWMMARSRPVQSSGMVQTLPHESSGVLPKLIRKSSGALQKLTQEVWEFHLRENPLYASFIGDRRYDGRLDDMSLQGIRHRASSYRKFLTRLEQIPRRPLSEQHRITWTILRRWLQEQIAEYRLLGHLVPITNRRGFHISFPMLWQRLPLQTTKDFQDYIARLKGFLKYTDQHITLLQHGLQSRHTLPAVVLQGYEKTITRHIVKQAEQSMMYKPFLRIPPGIPLQTQEQLRAAAKQAIMTSVVPAYQKFLTFMTKRYIPNARKSIGASALPTGEVLYRHRVRRYTTLPLTPEQVHQVGLQEVERIRKEIGDVIRQVKFKGNFSAFLKFMRTHPKFYVKTPEEFLRHVSYVLKQMDGRLPLLFGRLPRLSYGIREIPEYIAPRTTSAYYMSGSIAGKRAGFFYINTYNIKSRPLYRVPSQAFHEAVPGHHLQIALQQELKDLPPFRRYYRATAYQEGWALYAERLGLEVGFYRDPYHNFGRLVGEMWRACRLVVDTGIHAMGWTRQRAIQYLANYTALPRHQIHTEIDRYISVPGQALAYKIGELKIRQLRQFAQEKLGSHFDIRQFHDEVLRQGALPLDLLEERIKGWVKRSQAANKPTP